MDNQVIRYPYVKILLNNDRKRLLINAATWIKCHRSKVLSDSRALTIWFGTVVAWYLGKGRLERVGVGRRKRSGCLAIFTFFFKNLEKKSETNVRIFLLMIF